MTDIKTFIGFFTDDQSKAAEIINFFQDRRWFDDPPEIRDGIPYLSDSQMTVYETNLTLNKAACAHFEDVNYVLLG